MLTAKDILKEVQSRLDECKYQRVWPANQVKSGEEELQDLYEWIEFRLEPRSIDLEPQLERDRPCEICDRKAEYACSGPTADSIGLDSTYLCSECAAKQFESIHYDTKFSLTNPFFLPKSGHGSSIAGCDVCGIKRLATK